MICTGLSDDHCCHLGGHGVCRFLAHSGQRWVCELRAELGDWDAVHSDRRYLTLVRPVLSEIGVEQDCGDWPPPGQGCATCGGVNDG